jgi:AraC-like DNA-binding protein
MLQYSEYDVQSALSAFIKKLWTLDNRENPQYSGEKSVLPNGCFTIVFIEGYGVKAATRLEEKVLLPGIYFVGQLTEAIRVDILPHTRAIMVQLYAWAPCHFSDASMLTFTDRIVPIEEAGPSISISAMSHREIVRTVYAVFKPLFRHDHHTFLIHQACLLLLNTAGNMNMATLSEYLGCSARYLQKRFKFHIGLTPKEYAIILKLRNAVDDIAYPQHGPLLLTRLALAHDFYDQAHFINTFRAIVKTAPSKFDQSNFLLAYKR